MRQPRGKISKLWLVIVRIQFCQHEWPQSNLTLTMNSENYIEKYRLTCFTKKLLFYFYCPNLLKFVLVEVRSNSVFRIQTGLKLSIKFVFGPIHFRKQWIRPRLGDYNYGLPVGWNRCKSIYWNQNFMDLRKKNFWT